MRAVAAILLSLTASAMVARAEEPIGIIQAIDREPNGLHGQIVVSYQDGSVVMYRVTPRTVICYGGQPIPFSELQAWWVVSVCANGNGVASRINVH